MNLIIDVGNTSVKVSVFQGDEFVFYERVSVLKFRKIILKINEKYVLSPDILISSTGKLLKDDLIYLERRYNLIHLSSQLNFPFKNLYKTPATIGADRLALISSAVFLYPKQNVLVIDAGTCLTYDFVNSEKEYLGGAISLGVEMRYKALSHYTNALPLLDKEAALNFIGDSTNSCIHSGVVNGLIQEIEGVISQYRSQFQDLTIILTGGDAKFLSKELKSSIFAHSNFLLKGLNYLLNYNLK